MQSFIALGGFLLLIIPGIIFAVWFSLAEFVLIAEDLRGMDALLKSREYVKGMWKNVFLRFLFLGVLSFIVATIASFIFGLPKISFIEKISQFLIWLFLTPLAYTYVFLVYSNLKKPEGRICLYAFQRTKVKIPGCSNPRIFIYTCNYHLDCLKFWLKIAVK